MTTSVKWHSRISELGDIAAEVTAQANRNWQSLMDLAKSHPELQWNRDFAKESIEALNGALGRVTNAITCLAPDGCNEHYLAQWHYCATEVQSIIRAAGVIESELYNLTTAVNENDPIEN